MFNSNAEIQGIVGNSEFSSLQTAFNEHYDSLQADQRDRLFEFLKGQELIDLGCGENGWRVAQLAEAAGAQRYRGVDFTKDAPFFSGGRYRMRTGHKPDPQKVEFIQEDMLTFLSKQDDNSANIMVNGIDDAIIDPSVKENRAYIERLAYEVARVCGVDHIVVGINSPDIFSEIERHNFKIDSALNDRRGIRAYHKG